MLWEKSNWTVIWSEVHYFCCRRRCNQATEREKPEQHEATAVIATGSRPAFVQHSEIRIRMLQMVLMDMKIGPVRV